MKNILLAAFAVLSIALAGCRRTDYREYTLSVPWLEEGRKDAAIQALQRFNGIDKSSYKFDFAAKTLTLSYDSMQLAQANIRYALEDAGKAPAKSPAKSPVKAK